MPGARDDHLLRLIQQAAAALKLLRARLRDGDDPSLVAAEAGTAIVALLGPQRPLLERLDGWSAANLLGDPDKIQLWSELLLLKAESERSAGRVAVADTLERRARSLATFGPKPAA